MKIDNLSIWRIFIIQSVMIISSKKKASNHRKTVPQSSCAEKIENVEIIEIFPSETLCSRTFSSLPLQSACGLIIGDFTSHFLKSDDFKTPKFYYAHN
ncbi:MAG: hypothetical protein ABI184_08310 [Ginsengibacter sp.]